jgi:hypothetical protein
MVTDHVRTFSALSNSASLPVPSTLTLAPKILILSVSMAVTSKLPGHCADSGSSHVLAIKIFAFSIRFGEFVAMDLSRIKPSYQHCPA